LTGRSWVANCWTLVTDASTLVLGPSDRSYPARLRRIDDAPGELYVLGSLREMDLAVAIVGARAASGHSLARSRGIAQELAEWGAQVVSGGAVGVDAAAHRGAIEAGGHTVVVLANGLAAPYPARNLPLFEEVVDAGGAIVTPYKPGVPPRRFHFVRRNRIIAAMVDVVLVVDASFSSGSLYTAKAARELGRTLAAVPGTPGCDSLIAQGAAVTESAADIADAIGGRPRRPQTQIPASGSEAGRVLAVLGGDPLDEAELCRVTGLSLPAVTRVLTGLELEGLALPLPGRTFIRTPLAKEALGG